MKNTTDLLQDQLNKDKQQCEHHPYLKELTTEQYKANLKKYAYYLQHTFASNSHPQYDFLEYLNTCDCIEQDNTPLQDIEQDIKGKYKYLYNFYINNIFESYQDKLKIIESQDKPQVRLYCYDAEQQRQITFFSEYYINALLGIDTYTPQQFFDRAFAETKKIFTNDAFNELKQLFLNMPNDTIEYEQLTLFDYEEEEQEEEQNEILPKLEPLKHHYVKQSNEHQFFNIFMIYFDVLFATNEMIIKNQCGTTKYKIESYADIIKARIKDLNQQIDAMQKQYNTIDCLTLSELLKQATKDMPNDTEEEQEEQSKIRMGIFAKYPNWHNDINFLRDIRHIKQVYNKNVNDAIKTIHEDKQKQYNEILKNKPYFDMLCKELLKQDINHNKEHLKEEQTKLDNIAISGTTEFYINNKIEYFKNNMLPKSANNNINLPIFDIDYRAPKPTNYAYPIDYLSSNITNDVFTQNLHKKFNLSIPYNDYDNIVVEVHYDINGISKEPINDYDVIIHKCLCTLVQNHINTYGALNDTNYLIFTNADIYELMYPQYKRNRNNVYADKEELKKINESLGKCSRIKMLINPTLEMATIYHINNYEVFERAYMPVEYGTSYRQGKQTNVWRCNAIPPLFVYASTKHQVATPLIALNTYGGHKTPQMRNIIWYIIERIHDFESKNKKPYESHILIDTILKECNINMPTDPTKYRKKRNTIISQINDWLEDAKEHKAIKDFELFTSSKNNKIELVKNQSIKGIEITIKPRKNEK